MFDKFIKWISIGFALLVFAIMLFAAVQNILANPAAYGIAVVSLIVLFLVFNGIHELVMMVWVKCDKMK